ncbi:NAD-dependent protein deacetylase SIR4 [Neofusicoccum parvum]|nr:NAD-dependent protein deacetylase SIR4 [Neofusicoccum parvum]
MPVMRIPFTDPLPLPRILPPSAAHPSGAIAALAAFLNAPPSHRLRPFPSAPDTAAAPVSRDANSTLLLTGAGISVASGLADYRGTNGTYTLNKTYRPIYYNEFVANHAARKRYWARSFLGWTSLARAKPNSSHWAVRDLGEMGVVRGVITQNVDSFHPTAHPSLQTLELHGYLRALVCLSCRHEYPRDAFQQRLAALNPAWAAFLDEMLASGALSTENPDERRRRGLKTNPDGDVDVPNVDYASFRYPACPVCLEKAAGGGAVATGKVDVDADGAWLESSTAGILKPAVIMFGESIPDAVKQAAEDAVDGAVVVSKF